MIAMVETDPATHDLKNPPLRDERFADEPGNP
jgi:hypothetical protein